jgi:hypothetical protein
MGNNSREIMNEKLKVDLEKLKITVTIIILLTGGLVGLLYKNMQYPLNIVLFILGVISEIIFVSYVVVLNNRLRNHIEQMEGIND